MQQFAVLHFNVKKGERNFQLMVQPGTPFQEMHEVLEEFKAGFVELQRQYKEQEEKQKAEAEKEAVPVEAELVS